MPTYQYRCSNCSHEFEEYQSIKASPLVSCPQCKQDRLQRVIGSGSVIFKGSGFYQTDYPKDASHKGGKSEKKESTGEKKPETKKAEPSSDKTKTSETKSDKPSPTDTNNKAAQ